MRNSVAVLSNTNPPKNIVSIASSTTTCKASAATKNRKGDNRLMVVMHFQNLESCNAFKSNNNMKSLFMAIKPVSKNLRVDERKVWVEISGLPLCAWGSNAYKKVATSVGRFMFFEDDQSTAMSIGRVCIATKEMKFISEVVKVIINGEEFDVHIHELGSWSINIDNDQTSNTSESVVKEDEDVPNDDGEESGIKDVRGISIIHEMSRLIEIGEKLGYDVKGTKKRKKRVWIKELCFKSNIHFLGVQESKMTRLELYRIKSMWGNYVFDYACSMSRGKWENSNEVFYMINIYGPHEIAAKSSLWSRTSDFIETHEGYFIIFGDMNEVRDESEREKVNYGPVPFKIFHSWMQRDGFKKVIKTAYEECSQGYSNQCLTFHEKLKFIKQKIKAWSHNVRRGDVSHYKEVELRLIEIEEKIDKRVASDEERHKMMNLLKECDDLNKLQEMDTRQVGCRRVTMDEIRTVVWDCGSQKAPGLDEFSFLFIKKYWEILKHDIETSVGANRIHIKDFRPISLIGVQYKFIAKILANCLAKAVDKVISHAFISGRQILDGPLMPSEVTDWYKSRNKKLMIFKVDFEKAYDSDAVQSGLLRGAKARDGQYNSGIAGFLSCIKINIAKSSVYEIGVSSDDIINMARVTGCASGTIPFIYLGLPIGSNMNLIANWQSLIDRFRGKLSSWKANLLSIGGRLTLIQYVLGSIGIYYMSIFKCPESVLKTLESIRASFFWGGYGEQKKMAWVKWSHVMASLDKGGLGVGSLKAFNLALLKKWRWRLVGCGSSVRFWKDNWVGDGPLHLRYNRLFHLDSKAKFFIRDRIPDDSWHWNIDLDDIFSVNATRNHIDDCLLPSLSPSSRWSKFLPRKRFLLLHALLALREWNLMITFSLDVLRLLWIEDWRATKDSKDHIYWLEVNGFDKMFRDSWEATPGNKDNAIRNFMGKLKFLEERIRIWLSMHKANSRCETCILKEELRVCDETIDKGMGSMKVVQKRSEILNKIHQVQKNQASEISQKAKIKWAIEGDENVKFFHGILNKKRNQSQIGGVMVNGTWIEDSVKVKFEFLEHFRGRRFGAVEYFFIHGDMTKRCNLNCIAFIPKVLDANMVKHFHPISLIGSLYKIIAKVLANRLVGVLNDLINEVQSTFLADRQILDGPFILNEVLQWCRKKKKHALIFKVDFEKAYDSLRWDFLEDVLDKFGFGAKWRTWIQSCLRSSRGSILINGSPTEEFQFFRGLKQGDPLSPFIFILIMESLHISFQHVVDVGLFTGINISFMVNLSHLASGLRINMYKSKIMGVNVEDAKVKTAATKLGCLVLKTPFTYLGTKVGDNMSRKHAWNEVEEKVISRLSRWKMKTLFIGVIKAIYEEDGSFDKVGVSGGRTCRTSIVPEVKVLQGRRYTWSLENDGTFSVASICKVIDGNRFQEVSLSTRWVKSVPIKVNILAWKVKSNALPTRFNISRRGIDIDSIDCPICKMGVETTSHVFFQCNVVRQIMRKISSWWNVDYMEVNSYKDWRAWLVSTRIRSSLKGIIEGIYYGLWWVMWNFHVKRRSNGTIGLKSLILFVVDVAPC
nr:RNA-directed DNA polymerase, eukaryota [Tanacetum cinerariifolium]